MRNWHTMHSVRFMAGLLTLGFHNVQPQTAKGVTLGWNVSPGSDIAGYRLYYGAASRSYTNSVDVGNITNASVSNLSLGVTYFFAVTAYNGSRVESDFGNEISCTPTNLTSASTNPPIAATLSAAAVTANSATLAALVNPQGSATTSWFDWGRTTNFGSRTASAGAGDGGDTVAVSDGVSGLLPGTIYFFRVAATNAAGGVTGATVSFTSSASAPIVSTTPVSGINWKAATLNGLVNPNGAATKAWFEYGSGTNYGSATPAVNVAVGTSAVPVSAAISGLTSGNQYHFRLVATNAAGRVASADAIFQTSVRHIARK